MVEWSRALGGVPIYLNAADRQWVMRADPAVDFWEGDTKLIGSGLTLVRLGGHFDGGTVLHWADWSDRRGVLLSGDILQVVPSGHVSFMWSYANLRVSAADEHTVPTKSTPFPTILAHRHHLEPVRQRKTAADQNVFHACSRFGTAIPV